MVRSFVSAGAALTCGWSVLFGIVQAATVTAVGQSTQATSGDSSTGSAGEGNNPSQVVFNTPLNSPPTFPDSIYFVRDSHPSPSDVGPHSPLPGTPSVIPAQKNQFPPKNKSGSLIAGRRGVSVFEGIIENGPNGQSGYARFVLNRAGRGSVSVSVNGEPKRVIPVGVDGNGTLTSASAQAPVSGQLVTSSDGSVALYAVISDAGQPLPVKAVRAVPPQEVVDAVKGSYTLIFDNETSGVLLQRGMTGFGTLRVNKRGSVTFAGRLSDGSKLSQGSKLNSAGNWALHAKGKGGTTLAGTASFADLGDSDCSGTLQWRRPMGQISSSAQTATVSLRGSFYSPAETFGDVPQWNFAASSMSGSTQVSAALAPAPRNAFQLTSITAEKAKTNLTKATGRLSGSFFRPGNPFRQTITGVIFQKTNQGFGFTTQTGTSMPLSTPRATGGISGSLIPWLGRFTLSAVSTTSAQTVSSNAESSDSTETTPEVSGAATPEPSETSSFESSSAGLGLVKSGVGTLVLAGSGSISGVVVAVPGIDLSIPTGDSFPVIGSINFTGGGIPTNGSVLSMGGSALSTGTIIVSGTAPATSVITFEGNTSSE